jgi:hypothetical protein
MTKLTLDDVDQQFNPAYVLQTPQTILSRDLRRGCNRFIITAAQNGTPVHEDFWACLQTAAKHLRAEILVIPMRYKNPTSVFSGSQRNLEWWAPIVTPYLWNQRLQLNRNLVVMGDYQLQPTAVDPLSGMDGVSGNFSGIFGHTKMRLRSVATPQAKMAKTITTTGACTVENYTASRAGKTAEFHHVLGALLVELDGNGRHFWLRQLYYKESTRRILDLDDAYYVGAHQKAPPALAGIGGDTHVRFIDPMVHKARHREGGFLDTIQCQNWIEHDLLDAYSCNPHHEKNPMIWLATRLAQKDSIGEEMDECGMYLEGIRDRYPKMNIYVVASNHDDMATRAALAFMKGGLKAIPHVSPVNLAWLGRTVAEMAEGCTLEPWGTSYPDALALHLSKMNLGKRVHILTGRDSLMLSGIEHAMHGDSGPNGSKGSVRNLARIGVKSWTGHGHAKEIFEGAKRVGTATRLFADYTHGPSSWTNADGLTNADGKGQLVDYIDGKFRL